MGCTPPAAYYAFTNTIFGHEQTHPSTCYLKALGVAQDSCILLQPDDYWMQRKIIHPLPTQTKSIRRGLSRYKNASHNG